MVTPRMQKDEVNQKQHLSDNSYIATYSTAQRQLDTHGYSTRNLLAESTHFYQPVLACVVRKTCQNLFLKGKNTG